jgi:hypothetical protein
MCNCGFRLWLAVDAREEQAMCEVCNRRYRRNGMEVKEKA